MAIPAGTHTLGPDNARLTVRTVKAGAAAKAGHNLLIEVCSWQATLLGPGDGPAEAAITLTADSRSLKVLEGSGGLKTLSEEDKQNIAQTIDEEVLNGCAIEFRSSRIEPDGDGVRVDGELELAGRRGPVSFTLTLDDEGRLSGSAAVRQTDFGMKPYTALFGTLKVGDEVQVEVDATLPGQSR